MAGANIKDIAAYCRVGVSTVSRVINDHPDVSEVTRRRVLDAINKFGYIPNNSARNLVRTSSDAIAVVVRGVSNLFFTKLIKVIEQEINRRGYTMALSQISSDGDEITTAVSLVTEKKLNGILFLGGRFNYSPEDVKFLNAPYVCCTYTNTFGNLEPLTYSSVTVDDKAEAKKAVEYLYGRGHRSIAAIVADTNDQSISELRYLGYKEALLECGLEYDPAVVELSGDFSMEGAYEATKRLISKGAEFTALFVIADVMAIAAIKALHDSGRPVPGKCSVMGVDGLDLSNYTVPTLTTLVQPAEEMALEAAKTLIDIIEGKGVNRCAVFETSIREGGSVAKI